MNRFTPGPWEVAPDGNVISKRAGVIERIAVSIFCSKERRKANAQLIAAAPTMLDALELALDLINELATSTQIGYLSDDECKKRDVIRAAIRAAKGGGVNDIFS